MMIVNPNLTEADRDSLVASIESELTDHGAKIISRDNKGVQRLAYRIHGSNEGYYMLYSLEKEGNFVDASNAFNIKKDIWRYMFTRSDE